ncbi:MAG: phosphoglycerate dehydrogenase [Planctomycetota bacterium]|nr:MAG: phosphoglycerate dehydrogenase [Planctomycetota bacterium]
MSDTSYPRNKIEAHLLEGVHPSAAEALRACGYSVHERPGAPTSEELDAVLDRAHILGIRSRTQLTAAHLARAPRLWAIGCFCIGTNQVDLDAAAERGIAVFNAPFANTRSVAELTIAEIVALSRRLFDRSAALHAGRWLKSADGAHEVRGRTLGIVGYGRIGSQVSVLAEALGMRVGYVDPAPVLALGNARAAGSLGELLAEADAVTLHVPETPTTRGLIGADEIAQMKPGALLINNARGSVVDVGALAQALREGRLGGAAADVFPAEPAEPDAPFESPLAGLPNVILSPHIGGSTAEAQRAIAEEVAGKLARFMDNGSTLSAVNLPQVDLPVLHADHDRILHVHRNVPGVLAQINAAIGDLGVNIAAEHLQSDARRSYVILDVDRGRDREICRRLAAIGETIRVRSIR